MVVLEQRLKASALFLQALQGFLLQQPGNLVHRQTAWGGGRKEMMKERTDKRSRRRSIDATFINILTRCYRRRHRNNFYPAPRARREEPGVDATGLSLNSSVPAVMRCVRTVLDTGRGKTLQSASFSVSQSCEVCSIKAAPTSRQSERRAAHRWEMRALPSRHRILDTKEQTKK